MRPDGWITSLAGFTAMFNVSTFLQVAAVFVISLVAGSTFGTWRGVNPAGFSATTFLEVHQQMVRGLNVLLPGMAMVVLALTIVLAALSYGHPPAFRLYLLAIVLIIGGGLITRLANQPINAQIMTWTPATLPTDWAALRDTWWHWHVLRTWVTMAATLVLLAAILTDRGSA